MTMYFSHKRHFANHVFFITEPNDLQRKELLQKKDLLSQNIEELKLTFSGRPTNFKSKENDLPPEAQEKASKVQEIQEKMKKLIHTVKGKHRKEIPVPDTRDASAAPVTESPGLLQKGKDHLRQIAEKGASAKKKITDMMSDISNSKDSAKKKITDLVNSKGDAAKKKVSDMIDDLKNTKDSAKKKLTDILSDLKNSKDSKVQEIKDTMEELLDAMKEKYRKGSFQLNTDQPVEDMLKEAFENLEKLRKISTTIICVLSLICVGILVCVAVYRTCHRRTEKDKVSQMEQGTS
ncbi:uncharacterized protein LOC121393526 [Xenopus laevis]|uniref:Uncharacterized protein LOC121393526 n=1 Tax=Xenopus laevis TaxID=8355 RepID=A0A8J1KPY4_XENLA|nr:uncharacterized protein LOC121393526 [Xenopus laevis]